MAKESVELQFLTNAKMILGELRQVNAEMHNIRDNTDRMNAAHSSGAAGAKKQGAAIAGLALRFVGYNLILNQVMGAQQKLIQFVQESVTAYREFETRLAEISTILGSEQLPLMERLGAGIENLSMSYGQATSDMSKGMYDILSAAFDAENALNLLTTATKASIAGLSDIRTSVDIFTTVLNTYGMQVEQATNVSNILFQSVIRGKFQFQDLEQALGYIAPIAAQAGIATTELMAALSTATRHGLHLDMTSRGLALAIQGIVNPSVKATKAAEKYGIEMNGLALRVMELHGWFTELNKATKEYGTSILGELIPNMRSLRVAMVLAGDVGLSGFKDDLIALAGMGNATEEALNKIMDTSQFTSNQLTQQWEEVKRTVGEDWDELVLNIQRGTLALGKFFTASSSYTSIAGKGYSFIKDDAIHNATEYLKIREQLTTLEDERGKIAKVDIEKKPTFSLFPGISEIGEQWQKDQLKALGFSKTLKEIDTDIAALVKTQAKYVNAINDVVGGILDETNVLGDLQLTLNNVELAIRELEDELTKTFVYGFKDATGSMKEASVSVSEFTTLTDEQRSALGELGSTIQGNLAYQYMALHAQREYADATHDVSMGLKISDYVYKEIPSDIQAAVAATREYTKAQKDNKATTDLMTAAMRKYQIQLLELQLKGMMRRRGLTRMEEKQIKKIQIAQAKARLEDMKGQKSMSEADVSTYQNSQQLIDDYLLKLQEEQYELKYTYGQQITDLETTISREGEKLQTRYDWWESTNQKIISNSKDLITTLDGIMEEPVFLDMLDKYGLKVENLKNSISELMAVAGGRVGTYVEPSYTPMTESPIVRNVIEQLLSGLPPGAPRPPGFVGGTYSVPETQLAMVHRGETIIPSGRDISGSDTFQINIEVNAQISNDYSVEKLGATLGAAIQTKIADKSGKSKYRMR